MSLLVEALRAVRWGSVLVVGWFLCGLPLLFVTVFRALCKLNPAYLWRAPRPRSDVRPRVMDLPHWGQHHFVELPETGIRYHYVAAGTPGKPMLLLIHGFPENWYTWRYVLAAFSKDYFIVAPDMRGYGETGKPGTSWWASRRYSARAIVEDMRCLALALDYKIFSVACHDWGGMIGWLLASVHRPLVERLVVLNAPHPKAFFRNLSLAQIKRSSYFGLFQIPLLPEWFLSRGDWAAVEQVFTSRSMGVQCREEDGELAMTPGDIEAMKWAISRPGAATAALNWYRQLMDLTHEDFKLASSRRYPLPMPVTVLWGTKDGALGFELTNHLEEWCSSVRVVPIEGASHWVQQDAVRRTLAAMGVALGAKPDLDAVLRAARAAAVAGAQ